MYSFQIHVFCLNVIVLLRVGQTVPSSRTVLRGAVPKDSLITQGTVGLRNRLPVELFLLQTLRNFYCSSDLGVQKPKRMRLQTLPRDILGQT